MTHGKPNKDQKELGSKFRKAREEAHLTQLEVAKAAGINVSYYAEIERGEVNPSFDKIKRIVKALKLESFDIV
jgi:transcriptional regulator with XRE-family HTH domain